MAYADNRKASPAGMAAAIGVQAAIGFAVITGLSVTQMLVQKDKPFTGVDFPLDPPPPPETPPPETPPSTAQEAVTTPPITVPKPNISLIDTTPVIPTTDLFPPPQPRTLPGPTKLAPPAPTPTGFDPVGAKPRNDPGAWLSDRDYKPSWARRDLTGTATFKLDIAASGKITGCRVTRSTGHTVLDDATCVLVQKRAKFEPARGRSGEPVAGSYTGSVLWQLPD